MGGVKRGLPFPSLLVDPKQLELLWYSCASKCLDYMLEHRRLEEVRVLLSSVGNQPFINKWLNHLEKGEVCVCPHGCVGV